MKKVLLFFAISLCSTLIVKSQSFSGTTVITPTTAGATVGLGGISGLGGVLDIYKFSSIPASSGSGTGHLILDSYYGVANTFGVDTTSTHINSWIQSRGLESSNFYALTLNPLGGNVGVGLTTPASLFHSAGQIRTGIPSGGLGGASATTGSLLFYNSSNANTINIQSGATTPSSYTWTLPLAQGAANTVLTNDGYGVLSWSNPNTGIANTAWLLTGNTLTGTLPASPTEFIGTLNASDWVVKTYSTEKMRIQSGGNVGIGTSSPSSKLHVNDGYIYISDPATAHGMTSIVPTDVIGTIGKNNTSGGLTVTGLNEDGTGNGLSLIGYIGAGSTSNPAVRFMGAVKSGTAFTVVPDNDLLFTVSNSNSTTKLALIGNGNMGLGTTTPVVKLDVDGSINIKSQNNLTWGGAYGAKIPTITGVSGNNSYIAFYPSGSTRGEKVRIDSAGNVGIGTTNPNGYKLYVNGTGWCNGAAVTSDQRFKTNINTLTSALNIIKKLNPKTYYFDTSNVYGMNFSSQKQFGFIAQDIEKILPELIYNASQLATHDSTGAVLTEAITYKGLNYIGFIPIMMKGIQEQQQMIDSLTANSMKLDSTVKVLNSQNSDLQNQISNCCSKIILDKGLLNNEINTAGNTTDTLAVSTPVLYQNNPNPFNQQTSIEYFIPTNAKSAIIMVFDLNGKLINTIPVTNFGIGAITINGNELYPGMFIYSLIVDEKIIDTKRMILTH